MSNLLSLELHGNGLSGELPTEIYNASKLQLLNVAMQYQNSYQCQMSNGMFVNTLFAKGDPENGYNFGLTGNVLDSGVNQWTSMKALHVFDNSFVGSVANEIGDLSYLGTLRLEY